MVQRRVAVQQGFLQVIDRLHPFIVHAAAVVLRGRRCWQRHGTVCAGLGLVKQRSESSGPLMPCGEEAGVWHEQIMDSAEHTGVCVSRSGVGLGRWPGLVFNDSLRHPRRDEQRGNTQAQTSEVEVWVMMPFTMQTATV